MKSSFRYILVAAFITAITVIVFLQFNSSRSINELINGNEDLMSLLKVKTELQQVQKNVEQLETEAKSIVIRGADLEDGRFRQQVGRINGSFAALDSFETDQTIGSGIQQLKQLVNRKISLNMEVLRTFSGDGKDSAEKMINNQEEQRLTDSIRILSTRIDERYQGKVTDLIRNADKSGVKAKTFGTILAILAAISSLFVFGYISYKIVEQQRLIHQLNVSELHASQLARVKENFLANMSHEIRTPLNAILGFTGLLKKEKVSRQVADYTALIHKAGENLLQIVNNILDISKIEAGMMVVGSAPFEIRYTFSDVKAIYSQQCIEKGLDFIVTIEKEVPRFLLGDEARLIQVMVNVTGNAIKFTDKGFVHLLVSTLKEEEGAVLLQFMVTDTGIGMTEAEVAAVFDRFQQSDGSITRKYGGTGLGLSIVKDLVHLMNGTIKVDSRKSQGSSFTIKLPFRIAARGKEPVDELLPENAAHQQEVQTQKVLIVEDNELNQLLLQQLLKSWGIPFSTASGGAEAVAHLRTGRFDLVLMDIQMPGMDGYTVTGIIRNELKNELPVIAMTADALPGQKERCIEAGMNDYIAKPIQEPELKRMVCHYLEQAAQEMRPLFQDEPSFQEPALQYLNLDYLTAISMGNSAYEKEVFEQFFELLPRELGGLDEAIQKNDFMAIRRIAHSLKTTVAVMGLDDETYPYLEAFEKEQAILKIQSGFHTFQAVCRSALAEARAYYSRHYL